MEKSVAFYEKIYNYSEKTAKKFSISQNRDDILFTKYILGENRMRYIKKMCILRQVKQGFSEDGKSISGLVKVEQYGKNLAVEVSVINFAPLSSGEYYCILADVHNKTEMLPLRGKSLFNILTDMEIEQGFCAVICFVKNDVSPIAYGVNGEGVYEAKKILAAAIPPANRFLTKNAQSSEIAHSESASEKSDGLYNDERLASENYFKEAEDGQELLQEIIEDAPAKSATENESEEKGLDATEDVYAENVLHPFATEPDGYYLSIKAEIDELMRNYPKDDTLCGAFSCSEWVRIKGEEGNPQYLVGVVYDGEKARYICYALAAVDKDNPPEEIKDVCAFVPTTLFDEEKGFFVIFQSTATGECIKPFHS